MKVQILGTGCPKCKKLAENVETATSGMGISVEVEKVTDINEIVKLGVMITPALVIDGVVKSAGKVLGPEEIEKLLSEGA